MARVEIYRNKNGYAGIGFDCPGCRGLHLVPTDNWSPPGEVLSVEPGRATWHFNGDLERPTLSPSLLMRYTYGEQHVQVVCHSFVREGKIQFLGDCTHHLKGQTVDLPTITDPE